MVENKSLKEESSLFIDVTKDDRITKATINTVVLIGVLVLLTNRFLSIVKTLFIDNDVILSYE